MTNKYGVDVNYFRTKLQLIVRDLENYKSEELQRELQKLIVVLEETR